MKVIIHIRRAYAAPLDKLRKKISAYYALDFEYILIFLTGPIYSDMDSKN